MKFRSIEKTERARFRRLLRRGLAELYSIIHENGTRAATSRVFYKMLANVTPKKAKPKASKRDFKVFLEGIEEQ
jgi:hypothetical protein